MSMSSSVVGIRPPDKKWLEMKKVYDACLEANIPVPKKVDEFFNGEPPDDLGVEIPLGSKYGEQHKSTSKHEDEMEDGFLVDLDKLPEGVRYIRFVNSY